MPILRSLPILLLLTAALAAQEPDAVLDPETGLVLAADKIYVEPIDLAAGWLELTPLASDAVPSVVRLGDRRIEDGELTLRPDVPDGAAMLCTAGKSLAVLCEQVYVQGRSWVEPGELTSIVARFETGVAVTGRYLLEGWPMAGTRVAVVPTGIEARRAFTMPLGIQGRSSRPAAVSRPDELLRYAGARRPDIVRREVTSDRTGLFQLPRLAAGEYFLEAVLPSGRVHRSEPFTLPTLDRLRRQTAAGEAATVVWDLGEIDVADGLVVQLEVTDLEGEPLSGARVAGRQGATPETLINYQATTDRNGEARLSGFVVEERLHLGCHKEGYRTFERDYDLPPVLVTCALEPLADVTGELLGIEGLPPPGARVSIEPVDAELGPPPEPATIDSGGRFSLGELAPGEYELTAAAPGYEVAEMPLTLEPGQRLDLGAIVLLLGRGLPGRVIDAKTREPVEGVEIRAVSPPGAAFAVSGRDGGFTLSTRSEEALVLRLTAEEYASREVEVSATRLEERKPLLFEMERGGWIRAFVWDEAADSPCRSCRLLLQPVTAELVTDGRGVGLSEALAPGWYRVYLPRVTHLGSTVIEQENAEYRHVRVRRGKTSTVRFGERRQGVRVVFSPSPGPDWTLSARTPWRAERYRQQPGGGFRVRHRPGESLDLHLHFYDPASAAEIEVRQATMPADHDATDLVVPLAGAHLRGRATDAGTALTGERVRLRTLDGTIWATARTRPDGSFSIPHVPAGVYAVVIGDRNVQFASLRDGQALDLGTFELAGSY